MGRSERALDDELEGRLRTERILWLGTTAPDGAPHLVPVWFVWDGRDFLVFSKPGAVKVRHIAAEPRVAVALGEPDADFDVQLVDARAELLDSAAEDVLLDTLVEKYADRLDAIGLDRTEYAATYSQPIRIRPTRFLPWRGRSWLAGRGGGARDGRGREPRVGAGPSSGKAMVAAAVA